MGGRQRLGGVLSELFVHEMTSARVACDGCDAVEPLGAEHVCMHAPASCLMMSLRGEVQPQRES
jgi:hypothetical protein